MALVEDMKKAFGLSENATEDEVAKALADVVQLQKLDAHQNGNGNSDATTAAAEEELKVEREKLQKAVLGLRETSEQIQLREYQEAMKKLREEKDRLESSLRLTEANAAVQQLSEGKGFVLPVPAQEKLLQILIKSPKQLSEDIVQLFAEVKQKGLIELEERGRLRPEEHDVLGGDDPIKMFTQGVDRRMAENQVGYVEAVHQLASENPALYKAYRNATFIEGQVK